MNAIVEYYGLIESGEIITSYKVKRTYQHIVEDIIGNEQSLWEYDHDKARHAIDFIEVFTKHSKGNMGGQPFILELWQKALVSAMFGIVDKIDETRKYQETVMIVGRKNGRDLPPNIVMC